MILRSLQRNRILTDRRDDGPRIFAWPDLVVADRTSPYPKQRRWRPHRRAGRALAGGDARLCRPRPEARHARDLSAASAPMAQPVVPRLLERPVRGDPHRRQNLRGDAGGGRTDGNADRCCHAETVGGRHAAGFAIGYPAVPSAQAERWVLVYLGTRHSPANAPIFSRSSRAKRGTHATRMLLEKWRLITLRRRIVSLVQYCPAQPSNTDRPIHSGALVSGRIPTGYEGRQLKP